MEIVGKYKVRAVRDEDAQDIFGLVALVFADYPGCFIDPHDDMGDLVCPAECLAEEDDVAAFWVVEDKGGRVGACVGATLSELDGTAELHRLYVRHDLRGQGIGNELCALVEEWAETKGADMLELWSDTRFTDAHRLYERRGYEKLPKTRELRDISRSVEFGFIKDVGEREI